MGGPDGVCLRFVVKGLLHGAVCHPPFGLESGGNVGLFEILPLEEKRLAGEFGERVSVACMLRLIFTLTRIKT